VSQINTNETRTIAEDTFNRARDNLIKFNDTLNDALSLEMEIREFVAQNKTKPEDIEKLSNQILAMKIDLDPDEITNMGNKIKEAVHRLTNIDAIIEETKDDLRRVNYLKERAESAKYLFICCIA
jgi:laminin beta 1